MKWVAALMVAALLAAGGETARAETADETFASVNDKLAERHVDADEEVRWECLAAIAEERAQAQQDAAWDGEAPEEWHEPDYGCYGAYSPSYGGDGFEQEGVREYNGRTETWYSSNQLHHYRTDEWEVDDEGYYRDSEGRYVVAASDVPEGTEIETSKGTGIVLDSGCDEGVTDFYTAF